jgi:hypothetical protein
MPILSQIKGIPHRTIWNRPCSSRSFWLLDKIIRFALNLHVLHGATRFTIAIRIVDGLLCRDSEMAHPWIVAPKNHGWKT